MAYQKCCSSCCCFARLVIVFDRLLEGWARVCVSLCRLVPDRGSIIRVSEDAWLLNQLFSRQLLEWLKLEGRLELGLIVEEACTLKRSSLLLLGSGLLNRINVEVF